jgi:regulator of nonsense transcripts 3
MPEEKVKEVEEKPEKPLKKVRSFLNKIVIRKLPPNLGAEGFLEIVSPIGEYLDFYFCPADYSLGEATSRAYIEFKREEDVSSYLS